MKKCLYFAPAVIALAIYLILGAASGIGSISPFVWVSIVLMVISALYMLKEKWYGCIGGLVVGGSLIYMSTQYTGQVIDIEMPLGLILCAYYLLCGITIYKKNH